MNMEKAVTRRISRNLDKEVKTQVNNTMVKQVDKFLGGKVKETHTTKSMERSIHEQKIVLNFT
jgi:hypothetical protein